MNEAFFGETGQGVDPVVNAVLFTLEAYYELPIGHLKLALVSCYEFLETTEQLAGKMPSVRLRQAVD